ncbi:MAG: PLP-dependent aminotransferase family protein [Filifactoraceae bacterium]
MRGQINLSMCIDKNRRVPIYKQLEEYIKESITCGKFKAEDKLPSIREAAQHLGISKTSIENAYSQLVVEGYIENRPQRGYYVASITDYKFESSTATKLDINYEVTNYFNNGVDPETLDPQLIKKLYSKVILEEKLNEGGDIQGEYKLRKEISEFVNQMRGGNTSWEQVIVGAGTQYLLGILIGITSSKKVFIEDPGFRKAEYIFQDYNMEIEKVRVGDEGLKMEELANCKDSLIYVSPSHQYPLGSVMTIGQRLKLLNWAQENNSLIIEDDYDGIVRYDGNPIPCLQGLDKKYSVIYLGSFSKTFSPSLRVSYMIVPKNLLERYNSIKHRYTQSTSRVDQLVMARFIDEGHMSKHLRKIRRIYKKKNQIIVSLIQKKYNEFIRIINADSGFHLCCLSYTKVNGQSFKSLCESMGLEVEIVEERRKYDGYELLYSFTYSGIENNMIEQVVKIVVDICNFK